MTEVQLKEELRKLDEYLGKVEGSDQKRTVNMVPTKEGMSFLPTSRVRNSERRSWRRPWRF